MNFLVKDTERGSTNTSRRDKYVHRTGGKHIGDTCIDVTVSFHSRAGYVKGADLGVTVSKRTEHGMMYSLLGGPLESGKSFGVIIPAPRYAPKVVKALAERIDYYAPIIGRLWLSENARAQAIALAAAAAPEARTDEQEAVLTAARVSRDVTALVGLCDCPKCGAHAITELTPAQRLAQPDDTTHVCHPSLGGCNHGFTDDRTRDSHGELVCFATTEAVAS